MAQLASERIDVADMSYDKDYALRVQLALEYKGVPFASRRMPNPIADKPSFSGRPTAYERQLSAFAPPIAARLQCPQCRSFLRGWKIRHCTAASGRSGRSRLHG
jgi:hypothetical protein